MTLTVKLISSQTFIVEEVLKYSRRNYKVNLLAHAWNGSCNCKVFKKVCLFVLTHQGNSMERESTRCRHLLAAREWAMEHLYPKLVEEAEKIIELPIANETRMANRTPADVGI